MLPETKKESLPTKTESDFFLISFPKCGRTWLRLMIGRVFQTHFSLNDANLLDLGQLAQFHPNIPKISVIHDDYPQWKKPDDLTASKAEYKDKQAIFLVRDPRDVLVSSYFQKTKRRQAYQGSLSDYLHEEVGSFKAILRFYNIWAENRSVPQRFLLVRYEDIHADPCKELRRVIDFLGLPKVEDGIIAEAAQYASFENMRKMEEENAFNIGRLSPADRTDPESYKTRKGKVGGFTDYLNAAEIEYLNRTMAETLSDFYGYKP